MENENTGTMDAAVAAGDATVNKVPASYVEGVHAWRRFFARVIDNMVNGFTMMMVIGIVMTIVAPDAFNAFLVLLDGPGGMVIDLMVTLVLAMFLNALLIGTTGRSLGKLIMGVYVSRADGSRLGCLQATKRELMVWMRGLGFGIPLVSLFTLSAAYSKLTQGGVTSWDCDLDTRVTYRKEGVLQYILTTLGIVVYVAMIIGLRLLDSV